VELKEDTFVQSSMCNEKFVNIDEERRIMGGSDDRNIYISKINGALNQR
jgi:hypothetical protein